MGIQASDAYADEKAASTACGMVYEPDGQTIPAHVSEVKEESIVIAMNHPLAGKDLQFDIKVVSIE